MANLTKVSCPDRESLLTDSVPHRYAPSHDNCGQLVGKDPHRRASLQRSVRRPSTSANRQTAFPAFGIPGRRYTPWRSPSSLRKSIATRWPVAEPFVRPRIRPVCDLVNGSRNSAELATTQSSAKRPPRVEAPIPSIRAANRGRPCQIRVSRWHHGSPYRE